MPQPPNLDGPQFDVFPSFRGRDTRYAFTAHLRVRLKEMGLTVFADDNSDDLARGESLEEAFPQAIERSTLYAVVLSKNYASSEWCLDELVVIMRCCQGDRRRHKAIPIFYHVSPDEVAGDDGDDGGDGGPGSYKVMLERLEAKRKFTDERVDGWKKALAWITGISGWTIRCGDREGLLVEQISTAMAKDLQKFRRQASRDGEVFFI